MKPYYQDDAVTIYHGDCREILPTLDKVDLVLTDPPYGIGRSGQKEIRNCTKIDHNRKGYEDFGWDNSRPSPEIFRAILAASTEQIIWGGNYFADMLPPSMGWLFWDKGQSLGQADGELAWTSFRKALRRKVMNRIEIKIDGAQHPTQKPEKLMTWAIAYAGDPQTIIDPFMGSGTTLRAAKDLRRKATGIELEERYCEIAAQRMSQEVLPL